MMTCGAFLEGNVSKEANPNPRYFIALMHLGFTFTKKISSKLFLQFTNVRKGLRLSTY